MCNRLNPSTHGFLIPLHDKGPEERWHFTKEFVHIHVIFNEINDIATITYEFTRLGEKDLRVIITVTFPGNVRNIQHFDKSSIRYLHLTLECTWDTCLYFILSTSTKRQIGFMLPTILEFPKFQSNLLQHLYSTYIPTASKDMFPYDDSFPAASCVPKRWA